MYDQPFGLTGRPFDAAPDPAFWFESATQRRALAYLGYGLAQDDGMIVVTGEAGAGKTALVGHLLATLDRDAVVPLVVDAAALDGAGILAAVAARLGVDSGAARTAAVVAALRAVAAAGRCALLVVEAAAPLTPDACDELGRLADLADDGRALLRIVVVARAGAAAALYRPGARGRVAASHHLGPLAAAEVAGYVRHRLALVGWRERPRFADSAFAALHRRSEGVPGRLNRIAARVLRHAAFEGIELVTAATVEAAARSARATPGDGDAPTVHAEAAPDAIPPAPATAPAPPPASIPDVLRTIIARPAWTPAAIGSAGDPPPDPPGDVRPASRPRHAWLTFAAPCEAAAPPGEAPAIEDGGPAVPASSDASLDRLAVLEARIEEQDAALRRVLTLLIDWVERGEATRPAPPARHAAA